MKQKYIISKSEDGKQLIIKEFAEIDKDLFSQLCEAQYKMKDVKSAISEGPDQFTDIIRSRNLFPPLTTVQQFFAEMDNLNSIDSSETIEVFTDDVDILAEQDDSADVIDDIEDDTEELDELLENDVDAFDDKISVKNINTTIKVDDNETADDNTDI
jgi:hypothetical protein